MKRIAFIFATCTLLALAYTARTGANPKAALSSSKNTTAPVKPAPEINLVRLVDSLHIDHNSISMEVSKSQYQMRVLCDSIELKTYPVVFGFNPVDDKLKQGDGCTPEGTFKLRTKYPHSGWSKFIWIDYPNADSWARHKQAKADGKIPKSAAIGGDVGIHGVPAGYDYMIDNRENWTLGCISLKNKDVNELYAVLGAKSLLVVKK